MNVLTAQTKLKVAQIYDHYTKIWGNIMENPLCRKEVAYGIDKGSNSFDLNFPLSY